MCAFVCMCLQLDVGQLMAGVCVCGGMPEVCVCVCVCVSAA